MTQQTLDGFLTPLGLQSTVPIFEGEELTLEVLMWMAVDEEDDFASSMDELGIDNDAATRLQQALKTLASNGGPTEESAAAAAPAAAEEAAQQQTQAPAPAPPLVPDEDVLGLVGRRVLISGLVSRKDLNGKCGHVLFHDATSGRYTVRTEGEEACTVALKPTNLDAAAAKDVPPPKRPGAAEDPVDVSDGAAASKAKDVAQSDTTLESAERTAMYEKARQWKKAAEPGSREAYYKEKNKEKRLDDDARLAAWKAAHPEVAARMDAAKAKANKVYGANAERGARAAANVKKSAEPPPPLVASYAAPPKPTAAAKEVPRTAELDKAMAALRAASAAPPVASKPTSDLLASVLGKAGAASVPAVPAPPAAVAAARQAPTAARSPAARPTPQPTAVQDLLASALGKSGVDIAKPAGGPAKSATAPPAKGALDAYKRRQNGDAAAPEGDYGTVSGLLGRTLERHQAEKEEARYRDKHAFVGEHYNDI